MKIVRRIIRNILVLITATIFLISESCKKDVNENLPEIITAEIRNITETAAVSGGTITSDGGLSVIMRGVCWSVNPTPTVKDEKTIDGSGGGPFTSQITGLYGGTKYFLRAYATNDAGTGYGMALAFKTTGEPPSAPIAITKYASNILLQGATLNGNVNAKYYSTAVSFEYGTTKSYGKTIIAKQTPILGYKDTPVSANIGTLEMGSTYHFRLKATNSLGTSFGNDLIFKTHGKPSTDTINNTLYFSTTANAYYSLGFTFSLGRKISTLETPPPDIIIFRDGSTISLEANNLKNSFSMYGEYLDAASAKKAFDALRVIIVPQWIESAEYIKKNQIWIFRTSTQHCAKIRIISLVSEQRSGWDYAECIYEWVYQPDGSLTFPSK